MFCSKCGNVITDNANFCLKCGQSVKQAPTESLNQRYMLTIVRANQWFAINPPIKLIIDNNAKYEIENGKSINIPISVGTHTLSFSCSIRNKVVTVNISQNTEINVKWNRFTGGLVVE